MTLLRKQGKGEFSPLLLERILQRTMGQWKEPGPCCSWGWAAVGSLPCMHQTPNGCPGLQGRILHHQSQRGEATNSTLTPRTAGGTMKVKMLLSHVWLFVIPWTVAPQAPLSMEFSKARILKWVASPFSKGIFPTQGSNPHLLHCGQILYFLSHQRFPPRLKALINCHGTQLQMPGK